MHCTQYTYVIRTLYYKGVYMSHSISHLLQEYKINNATTITPAIIMVCFPLGPSITLFTLFTVPPIPICAPPTPRLYKYTTYPLLYFDNIKVIFAWHICRTHQSIQDGVLGVDLTMNAGSDLQCQSRIYSLLQF